MLDPEDENGASTIIDILEYLREYPDKCHHLVKDCVYSVLMEKKTLATDLLWHTQIEQLKLISSGKYVEDGFCKLVNAEDVGSKTIHYITGLYESELTGNTGQIWQVYMELKP